MEVGIEECLHIEFEFEHNKFHLRDVVKGTVRFNLIRIKIKHMELTLLKKETVGSQTETE
jgi:vacuolar protein sorting-associated protein 26